MIKKILIIFCIIMLQTVQAQLQVVEPGTQTIQVGNRDKDEIIIYSLSGLDLFGDERNNFFVMKEDGVGGQYTSGHYTTATNFNELNIKYPIVIKWAYKATPDDVKTQEINSILNVDPTRKRIKEDICIYLFLFNGKFHMLAFDSLINDLKPFSLDKEKLSKLLELLYKIQEKNNK